MRKKKPDDRLWNGLACTILYVACFYVIFSGPAHLEAYRQHLEELRKESQKPEAQWIPTRNRRV